MFFAGQISVLISMLSIFAIIYQYYCLSIIVLDLQYCCSMPYVEATLGCDARVEWCIVLVDVFRGEN